MPAGRGRRGLLGRDEVVTCAVTLPRHPVHVDVAAVFVDDEIRSTGGQLG